MPVFTKDAGRLLEPYETKSMTGAYRDRKLAVGLPENDYVRSEFFGINQVQNLLNQPGCVGLRIHYAKRMEDADGYPAKDGKGQLKPRVLLTGVDANGRDLPGVAGKAGLKDDGDGDALTVGEGWTCPKQCA